MCGSAKTYFQSLRDVPDFILHCMYWYYNRFWRTGYLKSSSSESSTSNPLQINQVWIDHYNCVLIIGWWITVVSMSIAVFNLMLLIESHKSYNVCFARTTHKYVQLSSIFEYSSGLTSIQWQGFQLLWYCTWTGTFDNEYI